MISRLKGVKKARAKGKTYYYHRKTGKRLPADPNSAEFIARVRVLDAQVSTADTGDVGTFGALVAAYRASPEFARLAPATRLKYQQVLDELKGLAKDDIEAMTPEFMFAVRDKKFAERKRAFTNLILAVLKTVFNWGIRRRICSTNPAAAVDRLKRPKDAPVVNRPWRPEEVETVLAAAPAWLRVPIALAAYTGMREGDVARATWASYDGHAFETRTQKTDMPVWVPAHYRLKEILDAAPRTYPTIVLGARGKPVGRSNVTTGFWKLISELRDAGKVGPGLSFHGLRHTLGTALAEMGCDPPTIAAVLGQATTQMAEHYSRTANRRRLTSDAIGRLEQRDRNKVENI